MASAVSVCNRALQKLGADRITSLTEDTPVARECNACYEPLLEAELRAHPWNFAVKRAMLAADSDAPPFGYSLQYTLPVDFLRLLHNEEYGADLDYKIEGDKILCDMPSPLNIRYIARVNDHNLFDALFAEAFATRMAFEMAEKITQSNAKGSQLREDYKQAIREARKANAFERVSIEFPASSWERARL